MCTHIDFNIDPNLNTCVIIPSQQTLLLFIYFRLYNFENLEEYGVDDLVHDLQQNVADDKVDDTAFTVVNTPEKAVEDTPYLLYKSSLLELAPELTCSKCSEVCTTEVKQVGSAVVLIWVSSK